MHSISDLHPNPITHVWASAGAGSFLQSLLNLLPSPFFVRRSIAAMSQNEESTTSRDEVAGAARDSASPDPLHTEPTSHQAEHSPSVTTPNAAADVPNTKTDIDPTALTNGVTQKASTETMNGTSDQINGTTEQNQGEQADEDTPMEDQATHSKHALEDYDWQELEDRFAAKMIECQKREDELGKEFAQWLEVCSSCQLLLSYTRPCLSHFYLLR